MSSRIRELDEDPRPVSSLMVRTTPDQLRDLAARLERVSHHDEVTEHEVICVPFTDRITLLYEPKTGVRILHDRPH